MVQFNNLIRRPQALIVAALILVGLSTIAAGAANDSPSTFGFRRGIALAHVMAWAAVEPGPSHAFVFPPFDDSRKSLPNELKALRQAGFDFVRLAVDPGPFLQFKGSRREYLDDMLMNATRLILSSGLSVIVDFHPSDMNDDYSAQALTRGVNTPVFQAYLSLLAGTATLLDRLHSRNVALEIMNEPPVTPDRWQPMLQAAYRTIRDRAPSLLLVLDGGDEGSAEGTVALSQFTSDPAILFSFHYYEPYQFTHQGAPWVAARYLADVPYPARARRLDKSLDASVALIAASDLPPTQKTQAIRDAQQRLESYRRSSFDRSTIAQNFDRITNWAKDHRVPSNHIFLGEFGVLKDDRGAAGARKRERAQWFRDVREEAEARGFVWAAWVYRGSGGFALVRDEAGTELDSDLSDALGLNRR